MPSHKYNYSYYSKYSSDYSSDCSDSSECESRCSAVSGGLKIDEATGALTQPLSCHLIIKQISV